MEKNNEVLNKACLRCGLFTYLFDVIIFSLSFFLQVIGCRGPIEINPRSTMAKESSVMGVNMVVINDVSFSVLRNKPRLNMTVSMLLSCATNFCPTMSI